MLSVSDIMWCWWQISKCLWYIGRLILATDNCSTHTDLSHCHSTTTNRERLIWERTQAFALRRCCLTTYLCLLFCVLINLMALTKNHKCCMRIHKFKPKINRQLAYRWINCSLSIPRESIRTIMHYTTIVIRHSETWDYACWECKEIVFHSWWRTDKLHCIFTVLIQPHFNTILYRCACWNFNFQLCNQPKWRSDVKCLAEARVCCLVKPDDISNGVAMDECEVLVKWGC